MLVKKNAKSNIESSRENDNDDWEIIEVIKCVDTSQSHCEHTAQQKIKENSVRVCASKNNNDSNQDMSESGGS